MMKFGPVNFIALSARIEKKSAAPILEQRIFLQLESIPDSIPSILKSLSIATILRGQIPDPLPGPREKDPVTDITLRLPLFQQLIEIDDAGIVAGEVVFDMLEEIVAVERGD